MGGSSESEYLTAPATASECATTSSNHASPYISADSESMMESGESGRCSSVEQQIEQSKCHWSELTDMSDFNNEEVADNREVFESLQEHPTWGSFFITFGDGKDDRGELVVGEKFAEGGQAELYHAQVKWWDLRMNENDLKDKCEWVLKVFKKGTLLRHLQSQWPQGLLQHHAEEVERTELGKPQPTRYTSLVFNATLLEDGRFAFLLEKGTRRFAEAH